MGVQVTGGMPPARLSSLADGDTFIMLHRSGYVFGMKGALAREPGIVVFGASEAAIVGIPEYWPLSRLDADQLVFRSDFQLQITEGSQGFAEPAKTENAGAITIDADGRQWILVRPEGQDGLYFNLADGQAGQPNGGFPYRVWTLAKPMGGDEAPRLLVSHR
jgi:hypothetical protein